MVAEDFVLSLLVIAAVAPVVVPLVEWLFKRHRAAMASPFRLLSKRPPKPTAGAGASPTPAPAVPHPAEVPRVADQ